MDHPFDLVVFGATGFVGKLVCEYLAQHDGIDGELRWAAAGRSSAKLEALRKSLGARAAGLPLIQANADDAASLRLLCGRTRVVVSTVGPYALYGEPLVDACVETGTDYCDLTGEAHWIRRMIESYEPQARRTGARMVHSCGFDSIPSDLGVQFLQNRAVEACGVPCSHIAMRVKAMRGGLSGGTFASMLNLTKQAARDPRLRRELANPYSLCPAGHPFKARQPSTNSAGFDETFQAWRAPFVMAGINTRIVHRSNALSGAAYGTKFLYDEAMLTGQGFRGRMRALATSGGLKAFLVAAALPFTRWILTRFILPSPGEGPDRQARERGFYDLRLSGQIPEGKTLRAKIVGDMDPGYGSTAKMLGQAAVCLAQDIPKADRAGGFWTPATIFGERLLRRLQAHAGMTFQHLD